MTTVMNAFLNNLDLFFINLSVYIFALNLISLTKNNADKQIEDEFSYNLDFKITEEFESPPETLNLNTPRFYFKKHPMQIMKEKTKIDISLYKIGVIIETIGIFLSLFKENSLVISLMLIFIYIVISIIILLILNYILKKHFIIEVRELDKTKILKQLNNKKYAFSSIKICDKNKLNKEVYILDEEYILIIFVNDYYDNLIKEVKKLKANIIIKNDEKQYFVIKYINTTEIIDLVFNKS